MVKATGCPIAVGQTLLFFWTLCNVFLAFYLLTRVLKCYSWLALCTMMLFGGLDIAGWAVRHHCISFTEHLEWWACFFQYSGMTTQLYWVFNQAVPLWLIMGLFLLLTSSRCTAAVGALAFAYSPFATVGLVPIAVTAILKPLNAARQTLLEKIRAALTPANLLVPVLMLLTYGSYYLQSGGAAESVAGEAGLVFTHLGIPLLNALFYYCALLGMEVYIYYLALGKTAMRSRFYWVVLIELTLIPLYWTRGQNDFCMRTSIPALFLLMVMVLQCCLDGSLTAGPQGCWRKPLVLVCLCIGFLTSTNEIARSVYSTLTLPPSEYLCNHVDSLKDDGPSTYFANEYADSFFYRYIMRR